MMAKLEETSKKKKEKRLAERPNQGFEEGMEGIVAPVEHALFIDQTAL
jgi:hypothetical protein